MLAVDRLLDEQDARDQALQLRRSLHAPPQIEQRFEIVILLVAVERDVVGPGDAVQHGRDFHQPLQIGVDHAAHLELEKSVAIGGNHLCQRLRQAVGGGAGMAGDGVDQADRVACGNARRRHQLREEPRQVEARQVRDLRRQQRGIDAGQIGAHGVVERAASAAAQGVEHGAVDLGRTEARDQRVEAERRPLGNLPLVMGGEMAERGARSGRLRISGGGEHERKPQLLEIVLVGEREILVEPLGRQQLRRRSPMRAAIGKLDPHAHERLRRLGERDNAEPKGQSQAHSPFVEEHVSNGEEGCRHVDDPLTGW